MSCYFLMLHNQNQTNGSSLEPIRGMDIAELMEKSSMNRDLYRAMSQASVSSAAPAAAPRAAWRRLFRLGVRQKVVIILTATLIVTLSASTWMAIQDQRRDLLDEARHRGEGVSQVIAEYLAYSVVAHDYHTIELLLNGLAQHGDIVSAKVINAKGNVMSEYNAGQPSDTDVLTYEKPIRLDGQDLGKLYLGLSVKRDIEHIEDNKSSSFIRQMLVIVTIMAIELLALTYIIVRPLGIITRAIQSDESGGEHNVPAIPLDSNDEFGQMATQFNALHARLNEAHRRLQARVELANDELRRANAQLSAQTDELKRRNNDLQMLALTDPLTGLYNKRYYEKLLRHDVAPSLARDETHSIMLINLTDIDRLNTEHGHGMGDEAIKDIARRVAAKARPSDILCRLEGGRFFLLCRQSTMANVITLADEICQAICQTPVRHGQHQETVNAYIGIATAPGRQPVRNAEEFVRCAEIALEHSRHLGAYGIAHYSILEPRISAVPA
jgi:diguanylate cyclase (GGDEF)-like protein